MTSPHPCCATVFADLAALCCPYCKQKLDVSPSDLQIRRTDLADNLPATCIANLNCPRKACADKDTFYVCLLCKLAFANKRKTAHAKSANHLHELSKLSADDADGPHRRPRKRTRKSISNDDASPSSSSSTNTTNNTNPFDVGDDDGVDASAASPSDEPVATPTSAITDVVTLPSLLSSSNNNNNNNNSNKYNDDIDDDNLLTKQNKDYTSDDGQPLTFVSLEDIQATETFDPNSNAPEYYFYEQLHPGQGAKYLTAKAFELSDPAGVTDDEAKFHLRITKFLNELTQDQQHTFADLILPAANCKDPDLNIFKNTRVPTSTADFGRFYLTGPNSVNTNLPLPVVKKTDDGMHAYVSLIEVIAILCASAYEVEQLSFEADLYDKEDVNSAEFDNDDSPATISKTRAAYTLYVELKKEKDGKYTLYLWVKSWSDDFDPYNTKTSRNQVWAMSNTISAPRSDKKGRNSFIMALGRKGDDHHEIHEIFADDMETLSKGDKSFFHGGRKRILPVKAAKICTCVDRPERAALFQIGDHNGTYSGYFGMAIKVDGKCLDNKLPSCRDCRELRIMRHLK